MKEKARIDHVYIERTHFFLHDQIIIDFFKLIFTIDCCRTRDRLQIPHCFGSSEDPVLEMQRVNQTQIKQCTLGSTTILGKGFHSKEIGTRSRVLILRRRSQIRYSAHHPREKKPQDIYIRNCRDVYQLVYMPTATTSHKNRYPEAYFVVMPLQFSDITRPQRRFKIAKYLLINSSGTLA